MDVAIDVIDVGSWRTAVSATWLGCQDFEANQTPGFAVPSACCAGPGIPFVQCTPATLHQVGAPCMTTGA